VSGSRGRRTAQQVIACASSVSSGTPTRSSPRRLVCHFVTALAVFLTGCGEHSLSKSELRAITGEIVVAARRVAGRQSEITIRPEIRGPQAADSVYISLGNPSQTNALRSSLADIARRHNLSVAERSGAGVVRFDLAFAGIHTHTIHLITPLEERRPQLVERSGRGPRLAIVIDDLGYDQAAADSLLALPFPITASVLPHLPLSAQVAEQAYRRGDQVLLHLPMEPESDAAKREQAELRVGMNREQVESALEGMLETVPHVAGVNNHEGSRASADPALMEALMPALGQRGLFFIDSRTTAATVAYDAAKRSGVRAASRKVFLDDTPTREAILEQLDLAARDAFRDGSAIAIGHPHPATIAALSRGVPRLAARGIRVVLVSEVLE
jgi:polysaccharide deacetylase 2 family uncharacterized protein YibQ